MVAPTFRDKQLEDDLCEFGYVHVPMFNSDQVTNLRAVYARFHEGEETGFVSDIDWAAPSVRRDLAEQLGPFWDLVKQRYLTPHRSLVTGFVTKWPGPEGLLPPHVHFTYVDPDRYRSVVVWVAVDDADDELDNGPLRVLPGSHEVADEYFGSGTRPWYVDQLDAIGNAMATVPTRAGDLVVMDGRLVHGSRVSTAHDPRVAMLDEAVPADADLLHPVGLGRGLVELQPIPDDILIEADPGLVARIFAHHHAPLRADELRKAPEPLATNDGSGPTTPRERRPLDQTLLDQLVGARLPKEAGPRSFPSEKAYKLVPPRSVARARRSLAWLASQLR